MIAVDGRAARDASARAASGRVARRRDRRKAEIVRTATEILAAVGYQAMNLEEVAERSDIAKATLYHYFSSKDELVTVALETLAANVLRRLGERELDIAERHAAIGERVGPEDLLAALVDEQLLIITETAPEVATVFSRPGAWPEAFEASMKDMRREHDAVFRRVVERGLAEGVFTCPDVDVAMQCLHGVLNQAAIWMRSEADRRRARSATVDCAVRLFI